MHCSVGPVQQIAALFQKQRNQERTVKSLLHSDLDNICPGKKDTMPRKEFTDRSANASYIL
jgi:hypothetical protein